MLKPCKKCKKAKELGEFHKTPKSRDGRCGSCKECQYRISVSRSLQKSPAEKRLLLDVKARSKARRRAIPLHCRNIPAQKQCRDCLMVQPIAAFRVSMDRADGHISRCGLCLKAWQRFRYANSARIRETALRARTRYRKSPHGKLKELNGLFVRKYKITIADYLAMLAAQNGKCALCREPPNQSRRLAVDHDHVTGEVRGLLCGKCNNTLERFDAVPDFGTRAERYLQYTIWNQIQERLEHPLASDVPS